MKRMEEDIGENWHKISLSIMGSIKGSASLEAEGSLAPGISH